VLAFPTPDEDKRIPLIDEEALYYRPPFASQPGVWPYLPPPAEEDGDFRWIISAESIIELTISSIPTAV